MSPIGYYPSNCQGSGSRFKALDLWHELLYATALNVDHGVYELIARPSHKITDPIEESTR
jgi:hypothetical protein